MTDSELKEKETKAIEIVREGRVQIDHMGDLVITATVEGVTDTYKVTLDPEGDHCSCPASTLGHFRCSHIIATELDVYRRKEETDA